MLPDLVLRFFVGGLIVACFAAAAEISQPKTFAGIFAAAPSVALATIGLTLVPRGSAVASVEAHAMIAGAVGFLAYTWPVSRLLLRHRGSPKIVAVGGITVWAGMTALASHVLVP